ncbi:hypothetical protein CRENPOLYSF2_130006 [Crenothrix polyspora]|uniref:Uncharacterized protein n=1 Tax=Crenothrix polyspora TaxID=360316 RepID=A0A1R4H1N8_9GAMM|nr:hypothetical protein CRENPOLYSF2_130006 [Crenothrix polyspora]
MIGFTKPDSVKAKSAQTLTATNGSIKNTDRAKHFNPVVL